MCFLNAEADLLVGHSGKLSRIFAKDYRPGRDGFKMDDVDKMKTFIIGKNYFHYIKKEEEERKSGNFDKNRKNEKKIDFL